MAWGQATNWMQPTAVGWGSYRPDGPAAGVQPNGQYAAFQPGAVYGSPGNQQYQFMGGTGPAGGQGYGTWKPMGQREGRPAYSPTQPASAAPTPQTPAPGQGAINVQTSITPEGVLSGRDTRSAQNLALANSSLPLPWLLQQYARPGISTDSPAMIANALPQVAQARIGGWQQYQSIPFEDQAANQANMLRGQVAREGEALGLAGALANVNAADQRFRAQNASSLLNLLSSFI